MPQIYVTGHRNPDLDSVSAAWCYARLKNITDPHNTYVPIRCGHMNDTTKEQFKRLGILPPLFVRDVRPRVADVVSKDTWSLSSSDPVGALVSLVTDKHSSVVPILDGGQFKGLLSLDEITSFFLRENSAGRPRYHFETANFGKIIRGQYLLKGDQRQFEACLMTGAMEFEVYRRRLSALAPDLPVLVVGNRRRHLEYAIHMQFPAIVLTGLEEGEQPDADFAGYRGTVYISMEDTAETIRLLRLSLPVRHLVTADPPQVAVSDLFDDAKKLLVDSEHRGLAVFDQDRYAGYVTRRCFLERPRRKIILVDHNELSQSIEGLEDAEVVEIIDHHRLAAEKTRGPIFIASEPVGSTCTIVFHQYLRWGVAVDADTASLLLAGITSDTVMLKSPTTTEADRTAVRALCLAAQVTDFQVFAEELFKSAAVLSSADPKRVIESDFKQYSERSVRFGIGQVEVTTLANVDEVSERYLDQLDASRKAYSLDWAMLMITDVIKENSILLSAGAPAGGKALVYPMISPGKFQMNGVLSRKKQLLPEILRVIEEGR